MKFDVFSEIFIAVLFGIAGAFLATVCIYLIMAYCYLLFMLRKSSNAIVSGGIGDSIKLYPIINFRKTLNSQNPVLSSRRKRSNYSS